MNKTINLLQELSIPLIAGVVVALIVANANEHLYHKLVETPLYQIHEAFDGDHGGDHDEAKADLKKSVNEAGEKAEEAKSEMAAGNDNDAGHGGGGHGWGHYFTLHFLINEIFMVLFFGIAAKEITESVLPGGPLNPIKNAINPLFGTIGGVLGPVGVYLLLNGVIGEKAWTNGWGIPTATDIALAWLVAKLVFGKGHPAISFLLLLAVADDAIGLGIIAFAYPTKDPVWLNTIWIIPGMIAAFMLRKKQVMNWVPYILVGGIPCWYGLYSAHLHPALALVFVVPFLPGPKHDKGMSIEESDYDEKDEAAEAHGKHGHSPLENFEHDLKLTVDFGLFFFAFANAGVSFGAMNNLTWIVFLALLVGKTVGIFGFSWVGALMGFPLPKGMNFKHLTIAGIIAGVGLTVALFVSGQAFKGDALMHQGPAKMGALFSIGIAFVAFALGKILGVKDGAGSK